MTDNILFSAGWYGLIVHRDNIYKMSRQYLVKYRTRLVDLRALLDAANALKGHVNVSIDIKSPELEVFVRRPHLISEAIGVLNEHIKARYEREWGEL